MADAVICVSDVERDLVVKVSLRRGKSRSDTERHRPGPRDQAKNGSRPVSHRWCSPSGRLERYKNIDLVIDAFRGAAVGRRSSSWRGTGPDRARLERRAELPNQDGRSVFAGRVPDRILDQLFAQANVVTSASDHEAFGLTLAEGLASGARVVASAIPAHADSPAGPGWTPGRRSSTRGIPGGSQTARRPICGRAGSRPEPQAAVLDGRREDTRELYSRCLTRRVTWLTEPRTPDMRRPSGSACFGTSSGRSA